MPNNQIIDFLRAIDADPNVRKSFKTALRPDLVAVSAVDIINEITAHLGAALAQSVPSDDPIIMGHVAQAHELAKLLQRAQGGK